MIFCKNDRSDTFPGVVGGPTPAVSLPPPLTMDVPLGFVSRVEKVGGQRSTGENAYGLEIVCKDIRTLRFALSKSSSSMTSSTAGGSTSGAGPLAIDGLQANPPRKDIFETLRRFSFPNSYGIPMFAFQFEGRYPASCDGWKVYDSAREFRRQGVPNESWRLSRLNAKYELSDTYPTLMAVPASVGDEELQEVAKFRSRGRIPVLCWMHPESQASICRCSQPLVGVGNSRSSSDERMVQQIMEANAESNRICIMDARPKVNAIANIVNGGGYEAETVYENVDLTFLDIHNIHVMRESLRKVKEVCFPVIDDQKFLTNVDNTQWRNHLSCILKGVVRIIDRVENHKTSVLVHCSDGWDRTSQLTSLAMLCLDPYYRSLKGFQVLVEKEWLSFGHKFGQRVGHGEDRHNDNDRSPVFLQFIDCVWQVANQFPSSFEFNEYFLTFVLDHLYSCLFGTFLYNCDRERRQLHLVHQETQSLWSFVNSNPSPFLNPFYRGGDWRDPQGGGSSAPGPRCIVPQPSVSYLRFWTGYFCRWNPRMRPQDSVPLRHRNVQLLAIKDQLKSKMEALKKELETKRKTNNGSSSGGGALGAGGTATVSQDGYSSVFHAMGVPLPASSSSMSDPASSSALATQDEHHRLNQQATSPPPTVSSPRNVPPVGGGSGRNAQHHQFRNNNHHSTQISSRPAPPAPIPRDHTPASSSSSTTPKAVVAKLESVNI